MEAGGETRQTRRAGSEARSRGRTTTIENPTASNPFTVLAKQAEQTDNSDEDGENDLTEGDVPFRAAPGAPKPKRSIVIGTPKQKTATIVVAAEGEDFSVFPPRRARKPSAKAKQNEEVQEVSGTGRWDGRVGVGGSKTGSHEKGAGGC
ncbi:hypothetical protein B0O99DRAFT_603337 [Bisporella sp. PMI_857]|nr:hypothetical protein B0O99DRAFT_603337 [Bisporella sp. PMI_857]